MILCSHRCTVSCKECKYYLINHSICSRVGETVDTIDSCNYFHCNLTTQHEQEPPNIHEIINTETFLGLDQLKLHTEKTGDRDLVHYWQGYVEALKTLTKQLN